MYCKPDWFIIHFAVYHPLLKTSKNNDKILINTTMGAKSNHYGDVYDWIVKIIESCEKIEQERMVNKLINRYLAQYWKKHPGFEQALEDQKFNESLAIQVEDLFRISQNKFREISESETKVIL